MDKVRTYFMLVKQPVFIPLTEKASFGQEKGIANQGID
jgi:hypothetical protein